MKKGFWLALLLLSLTGAARAEVRINEILACNGVYENGEAYKWIELKNTGDQSLSLWGMSLSFSRDGQAQAYAFPQGASLPAGGYGVVYCIGYDAAPEKGEGFFAPLDISRKGGVLTLFRGAEIIDQVEYGRQWGNISFGRVEDGEVFRFFEAPSRGEKNPSVGYERRAAAPVFSLSGGLYDASGMVTLSAQPGTVIRFTVDGREPTENSPAVQGPLPLDGGVTCIRARAFQEGALPSETVTQTYFVGVHAAAPVVSLVTDEKYLFDSKTGILVPGKGKIKNYDQDWEYPVSVEYYDKAGKQLLNQGATFRVTGATSRKYGQKTLSLFARPAYGEKLFSFNPFDNREEYSGYKSLVLRAAGTESFLTRFRDAMLASRAEGLDILYQEAVPVVVYINGEYWGHYNLRERVNKHMIAQFEGVEEEALIDAMTIIKGRGEVQQGDRSEWDELIDFCKKRDLRQEDNLAWVAQRLDIDNFFTHTAIEMVIGNADIGNVRYYKIPGGKWKCALYDLDAGMQTLDRGPIRFYSKTPQENSNLFYHEPFAALIRVPEMRERFFTRLGGVLLHYLPADLDAQIDRWVEALSPLMADQIARWPKCSPKSMSIWEYEVRALRKICSQRPQKVVDMVCSTYGLSKEERQRYFADFYAAIEK